MMNIQTSLYKSANGFVHIDNFIVPFEFLERLHDEVFGYCFGPEEVSALEDNCSDAFWASLSTNERSVFGSCLLILIENGLVRNFYKAN